MEESNVANTPKEVIERIRTGSYLLDIDSESESVKQGALSLQKKLNRALELLSNDLYNNDAHFVLELIQNADDNEYAPEATPHLHFSLAPHCFVIENNEVGFSEKNIEAICSVGESSKTEKKSGYIGEKGIGFKSVFTVSDAPEIHSNGYHFRFDRTDDTNLLGFVVPTWYPPTTELYPNVTTIILPSSRGRTFEPDLLKNLQSSSLLFLNKLRHLTINWEDSQTDYTRRDVNGVSLLVTEYNLAGRAIPNQENRYQRIESTFEMNGAAIDEKRKNVDHSTLVLALPLDANGTASPEPLSKVFAFLPIRPVGFKFSIHADFILNSSREDVLVDRGWNKALRDNIAIAFTQALETFKKSPGLAVSYLTYIPIEGDILDSFFQPISKSIIDKLAGMDCLLSASGTWKKPPDLRNACQAFRALFPSATAIELFGFDYVDARVMGGTALLQQLGVKGLYVSDVLGIFSNHGNWVQAQPLEWRAQFYAYIAGIQEQLLKEKLLDYPCVPTSTGDLVIPSKTSVFFPLNRDVKYGFENELVFIDIELYEAAERYSNQIPELFNAFGVKRDNPFDLVTSHILPRHKGEAWTTSEHVALVGHLRYLKDKIQEYLHSAASQGISEGAALKAVQSGIWIGTKRKDATGWYFDRIAALYLSKEYQPTFCMETLLGDMLAKDKLVSNEYLSSIEENTASKAEVQSWQDFFFEMLGINQSPRLVDKGNDFVCSAELDCLLNSPHANVRRETLECLDRNWKIYAPRLGYVTSNVQKATQFTLSLRATKIPSQKRATTPLSESYYVTQELIDLLGNSLPYIEATLSAPMLTACGVTFKVDAKALIKRLKQLKDDGGDTTTQLQDIYRVLDGRLWANDANLIKQAFYSDGLVRVKGRHKVWAKPNDVSWHSNGTFMDELFPPVQSQYSDFSRFFCDRLGVLKNLPTSKWVEALPKINIVSDVNRRKLEALTIYRRANRDLTYRPGKSPPSPDWLGIFLEQAVFLTQHGELEKNHENLYANDAGEIAALFADDGRLKFLAVPPNEVPRLSHLLEAAKVKRISKCVETKVIDSAVGVIDTDLTGRVRRSVHFLARILYAKHASIFDDALGAGKFEILRKFEVAKVQQLNLQIRLGAATRQIESHIAYFDGRVLYKQGCLSVKDRLAAELCKFVGAPDDLTDAFARILMENSTENIDEFLKVREVGALPTDLAESLDGRIKVETKSEIAEQSNHLAHEDNDSVISTALEDSPTYREITKSEDGPGTASCVPPMAPPPARQKSSMTMPIRKSINTGTTPQAEGTVAVKNFGMRSSLPGNTNGQNAVHTPSWPRYSTSRHNGRALRLVSDQAQRRPSAQERLRDFRVQTLGNEYAHGRGAQVGHRGSTGRLLSYANIGEQEQPASEFAAAQAEARRLIERAAVEYFRSSHAQQWASLTEMPRNNKGYDIKAITHEGNEEWIEVKGQSGAWTEEGITLTPAELLAAIEMKERYLLCVVEFANDEKFRKAYLIRNPHGKTQQFRFDSGWKSVAEAAAKTPLEPQVSMYITMPGIGEGRIIHVKPQGRFFMLQVVLTTGATVKRPYNPTKMSLSKEPKWLI